MPNATDSRPPAEGSSADPREVARIVRSAALASYGVTAVGDASMVQRILERLGRPPSGVSVRTGPTLDVSLNVRIAAGVPRDRVLANIADAVRYTVQRDTGRAIDALTVTADGG